MRNAIVILNYNDAETTLNMIHMIRGYENLNDIIVVDNCSSDYSYEKLKYIEDCKITVLKTQSNKGYASGNNVGVDYAINHCQADNIFISNPDIEITQNAIIEMIQFKESKFDCGLVTCKMICTSEIHMPVAWKIPSYKDCVLEQLMMIKKIIGVKNEYPYEYFQSEVSEVEVIPGSLFMISSDCYRKIGGFDENTFLYYEENIMALKLRDLGYKNYILNSCEYIHNHSVSISKTIKSANKKLKIAYRSRLYFCNEYLKINMIQKVILNITFYMGLFNYTIATNIKKCIIKK